MKIREMRELTRAELEQRRNELHDEQFNLKMRRSFKELDNPLRLRELKREIARINTVLREDQKGIRALAQAKTSILSEADAGKTDKK
jgi:large subunit ribosomal protein L29